jgi:putative ABC transport system permease protein
MINAETIKYSLRNLKKRKGRSFLTLFSILIGIATIFIFVSFGLGLYNYTDSFSTSSSADKLIISSKGGGGMGLDTTFKLTDDDVAAINSANGVYDTSGIYFTTSLIKFNREQKYTFFISYDPAKPLIMDVLNVDVERGRDLKSGDWKKVVLGHNYLIPGKIFDKALKVNDVVEIDGVDLKIVGFYSEVGNPQDDAQIYTTNDFFKELYPNSSYSEIIARVDVKNVDLVVDNVEKKLRKERGLEKGKEDFFVQSFDEMIASFSSALDIIVGFVILIALISVLVSAVNTANTMITSVLERYKEIGVLKAIGARNSEIFGIFLFESSFLGFVAGVLGAILGFLFSSFVGSVLKNLGWGFLQPAFPPILFIGCILFATFTGAVSGVLPAVRASKINTVDALRYE